MKIFISHAKQRSRILATALRHFIPYVLQDVSCFMSSTDIPPASPWLDTLKRELQDTSFGILCISSDNLQSEWIHYEAGSLAKQIDVSRVCPLLVDITPDQLGSPLNQFQAVVADHDGILKLLRTINGQLPSPLDDERFLRTFAKFWPDIEAALKAVHETPAESTAVSELIRIAPRLTFVERFPDFIEPLAGAIALAKETIHILVDFACFGLLAGKSQYKLYKDAIESRIDDGVAIKILVPSILRQKQILEQRYGKDVASFERFKVGTKRQYLARVQEETSATILNMDQFFDAAIAIHSKHASEVFGDHVLRVDLVPQQYFWIIDGKEAYFSIPKTCEVGEELGFCTNDASLLAELDYIFRNLWER